MNCHTTRREFLAITAGTAAGLAFRSPGRTVSAEIWPRASCCIGSTAPRSIHPSDILASARSRSSIVRSAAIEKRWRSAQGEIRLPFRDRQHRPATRSDHPLSRRQTPLHVHQRRYVLRLDDRRVHRLGPAAQQHDARIAPGVLAAVERLQHCFHDLGTGEPAAVASIEIYELPDLPPLHVPAIRATARAASWAFSTKILAALAARKVPCLAMSGSTASRNMPATAARACWSIRWLVSRTAVSFQREPSGAFDWIVARDRKQYTRWTTTPTDWYVKLLERLDKEGMKFQGAMTLMRLGSLLERMNINLDAIRNGAETFNNMLWNNCVQSSTNDWTPIYNARNYKTLTEDNKHKKPLEPWSQSPSRLAYGEVGNPGHTGPMFNPLHPTVQQAIVGFVREIGQRYGKYPAFQASRSTCSPRPCPGSARSVSDTTITRSACSEGNRPGRAG